MTHHSNPNTHFRRERRGDILSNITTFLTLPLASPPFLELPSSSTSNLFEKPSRSPSMPPSAGRRSTLATLENSNPGSSIPVPSSAIKSQRHLSSSNSNQYQQQQALSQRASNAYGAPLGSQPASSAGARSTGGGFNSRQSYAPQSSQNHYSQYDDQGGPTSIHNLNTPGLGSSQSAAGGNARRQSVAQNNNAYQKESNAGRQSVAGTPK